MQTDRERQRESDIEREGGWERSKPQERDI